MEIKDIIRRDVTKKLKESKDPDKLYEDYLNKHVQGVRETYKNIMYNVLLTESDLTVEELGEIETMLEQHDHYKRDSEEWEAYRNYFYDKENHPRSSDEFNYAWNHHQNHSPHHWQYWCLINDVDHPQVQALDMPIKYVIEMLCDWHSAGAHYGNSAYEWYEKQKDKMILSDNTRKLVEKYIGYLR